MSVHDAETRRKEYSQNLELHLLLSGEEKQKQNKTKPNGAAPAVSVTCLQPITASGGKTPSLFKGRETEAEASDRGGEGGGTLKACFLSEADDKHLQPLLFVGGRAGPADI